MDKFVFELWSKEQETNIRAVYAERRRFIVVLNNAAGRFGVAS